MYIEQPPTETLISGVNLKAAAPATYQSKLIDVRELFAYALILDITIVGAGAAGDCKLTADIVSQTGDVILHTLDILTAIDTFTTPGSNKEIIVFGGGVAPTNTGTGTIDADADIIKIAGFLQFTLEITTASDSATSSVASLTFLGEG